MLEAMDVVEEWAKTHYIAISTEKTEAMMFSLDPKETECKCQPKLSLLQEEVKYKKHPQILGVDYDPHCTFNKQAETATRTIKSR